MPAITFTPQQRRAIETTGRSVIVSAAAGSGKTAVLTERCAYLVCDAPPAARCNVDELLVLTFTEAAAAEMRSRIVEAIRARSRANPRDDRLSEQVALIDAARISTIHAFCLWLVRRWFSHVGIDPAATVLDADEAALLKREVLDALFSGLYETTRTPDHPLGRVDSGPGQGADTSAEPTGRLDRPSGARGRTPGESPGRVFAGLVDDYGLGNDRTIAEFVLRLFDFTTSLPDPDGWLEEAHTSLADRPEGVVLAAADDLKSELVLQAEHCEQTAARIETGDGIGFFYASRIRTYADQLRAWRAALAEPTAGQTVSDAQGQTGREREDRLARFEAVRSGIAAFEFDKTRAPALRKDTDPAVVAGRDAARAELKDVKERLFGKRLKNRFGLFSVEELVAGLRRTAPYVSAIVSLVRAFRDDYGRRKREMNVLDFADLERLAFDLLRDDANPQQPSEVARLLHRRFAHVLVDEFQDINPIQEAIIRLVSHEATPDSVGNLFVVGDVKQSIYRFRLAEPAVFTKRLDRFRDASTGGVAISLQRNFRSSAEILSAVNAVFRQLMLTDGTGVVYDKEAELHAGRQFDAASPRRPTELHLLERTWKKATQDDDLLEPGVCDVSDPARWTPIEREAFVIGSRIRDWMQSGALTTGDGPLRYRDIAVLLRATKINAERVAAMLNSMGVPAFADVGGSLFGAREVRDVLAALQVLDNLQQDIPLTAVLRSGILGEPLSEDDLVAIRCLDREIPFHAAVRAFAARGDHVDLEKRLCALLNRISRYRADAHRRPLADVLWNLYEEQGYLAYVGGLANGVQRRANLLKLHELARRFSSFRRQGLHRFLRFVQSLEEDQQEIATAPAIGEADDVVRIMSIHQAKGLEFPVVFVAGLGTRFHLGDRSGRMVFERTSRIGLRVVDTDRMIEYPSAAHRQVVSEIERSTRAEELRILYVAATRARDHLVLIGSQHNIQRYAKRGASDGESYSPSLLSVTTAMTPLDWLMPALMGARAGIVRGLGAPAGDRPLFDIHLHDVDEMADWRAAEHADERERSTRSAVARCEALPADEPLEADDSAAEEVLSRIEYVYPHLASASVRASMAASEFKGGYDFMQNPEERPHRPRDNDFQVPPSKYAASVRDDAAHRGVITHRILQHLDFFEAANGAGVALELQRMVRDGVVSAEALEMVDRDSIEWFASTPLAEVIRGAGNSYRREFPYIATEPLLYFDRSVDAPPGDHVLVRGIVDGILPVADGIELVDFKTDAVGADQVEERSVRYRPQMELYARAMARIWRRPVRACWLVFLAPRKLVRWQDIAAEPDR